MTDEELRAIEARCGPGDGAGRGEPGGYWQGAGEIGGT